jgi:hypothetical protein
MLAGPYVPPKSVQAAVKGVRLSQVLAVSGYTLGETLFASSPRMLDLLARAHENRFALGIALYLSHVGCELAYSTSAFEITYNGRLLFSKVREGRYPNPGEVSALLLELLAGEQREDRKMGAQLVESSVALVNDDEGDEASANVRITSADDA